MAQGCAVRRNAVESPAATAWTRVLHTGRHRVCAAISTPPVERFKTDFPLNTFDTILMYARWCCSQNAPPDASNDGEISAEEWVGGI
eukprot:6211401-Pleurochrysis_carterae.AAC.1